MEELSREAWAQAVVWVPTVFVALSIFLLFSLLSRAAHFGVLRDRPTHARTRPARRAARDCRAHLALDPGPRHALGTLGVNITGIVAGLGLTGFLSGFALKDSIANLLAGVLILLLTGPSTSATTSTSAASPARWSP